MEEVPLLTDYLTGQLVPQTPREDVRQQAAQYLVETLGYPKEDLVTDVVLSNGRDDSFVIDLAVLSSEGKQPHILVGCLDPGTAPPREVPEAVASCFAEYFFWFDGFVDYPDREPSWGARYFARGDDGFASVSHLPHHHRRMRPRRRRPNSRIDCPNCGVKLEQYCLVPCTDDCPGWACPIFRLLRCPTCERSFNRPGAPRR